MSGPVDHLPLLQWAGVLVPTLSVLALFVRLGSLLTTVRKLEIDMKNMTAAIAALTETAASLAAWRDASKDSHNDLLERVRRLEDQRLRS